MNFELYHGNCIDEMREMPDASVDACVTDGPYELGYMNREWDKSGIVNSPELWKEVLRLLKPGAHLLSFGGTRTSHRMTCAVEDAGFEIRDSIDWVYGTGFPKSLNVEKEMEELVAFPYRYRGQGTALKPGHEPITLARKPTELTVAMNVLKHGTGALNIDACRIGGGRWPANIIFDEGAAAELDAQTTDLRIGGTLKGGEGRDRSVVSPLSLGPRGPWESYGDSGGASRFFYVAKAGRKERDFGCEELPMQTAGEMTDREEGSAGLNSPRAGGGRTSGARNFHPTPKPVELMRYLVRLITPKGGLVLDPFVGSGTTGMAALLEGFDFVGIDQEEKYLTIAHARITAVVQGATP